jgi:hypothetical protein
MKESKPPALVKKAQSETVRNQEKRAVTLRSRNTL